MQCQGEQGLIYSSIQKLEAVISAEMSMDVYQTTRRYILQNSVIINMVMGRKYENIFEMVLEGGHTRKVNKDGSKLYTF
jgi:hypothetical protein